MTLEKYGESTVLFKEYGVLKTALEAGQNKIKELKYASFQFSID
tara:strand:- start:506 stop:637 length:132 start_codon:yes stop_codon:yes gene_type:complete